MGLKEDDPGVQGFTINRMFMNMICCYKFVRYRNRSIFQPFAYKQKLQITLSKCFSVNALPLLRLDQVSKR
jgi:hypothetical protein